MTGKPLILTAIGFTIGFAATAMTEFFTPAPSPDAPKEQARVLTNGPAQGLRPGVNSADR
jgi:hypothetical protein